MTNKKMSDLFFEHDESDLNQFAKQHSDLFQDFSRLEGLIVRGHILIERNVSNAIELVIPNKSEYNPDKFNFSQKIVIGNMLGICTHFKIEITALNKLRNQIAHTLQYDANLIKIIISEISKKKPDIFDSNESEIQRFGKSISFICGALHVVHRDAKINMLLSILPKK